MKKPFNKCPARIQRFLLRNQSYDLQVGLSYKKGKEQVLSHTLSRATEQNSSIKLEIPEQEIQAFVDSIVKTLLATPQKITEIKHRQESDETLQKLIAHIKAYIYIYVYRRNKGLITIFNKKKNRGEKHYTY